MSDFDQEANDRAVAFATGFFRLMKSAQMHQVKSLLAQGALETAAQSLREQCEEAGGFVTLLFAGESVFVNGQPVRTQRSVYENILVVGATLQRHHFNELTIRSAISADNLAKLLSYIVHGEKTHSLPSSVTLTFVDPSTIFSDGEDEFTITQKVALTYGAATVLVRRCNEKLRDDNQQLMRHVKRVAQRMVTLSHTGFPEWLALARRPSSPTDHARIAVNAAIIGVLAGRVLTEDVHVLLRIVMAALQVDVGKARVAGMYREDTFQTTFVPQLNQTMRQRLPASSALMLFQAGRAADRPMMRAVVTYETAHLADGGLLGWPYDGQLPPTVEAVIASVATRVASSMANAGGPDDLVEMLNEVEIGKIERASLESIYSILGLLPKGTPVQLSSGVRGVIVSAGNAFSALERPQLVLLLDQNRHVVEPKVVQAGEQLGWVSKVVVRPDEALNKEYEKWVKTSTVDDYDLPATTGVLRAEHNDSLHTHASLDFDEDLATHVLDSRAAASALERMPDPTAASPPSQFQQIPSDPGVPAQFQSSESSAPKQFEQPAAANLPKQFEQPAAANLPKQFQPVANVPKQFRKTSAPTQEPPKTEGSAKVAGAWIKPGSPAKKDQPTAKEGESSEKDESSEDGDFDALANIVLFD